MKTLMHMTLIAVTLVVAFTLDAFGGSAYAAGDAIPLALGNMAVAGARVIDPVLSNISRGYKHPERVGHVLFPEVPVQQRGGQIIEFGKDSFKRYNLRRAPGSNTKRVQVGYAGAPFALVQESLEGMVPFEHMEDASQVPGIDLGEEAVTEVMDILSLSLEIERAELARDASRYGTNNKVALSGTDQWTDSSSDPAKQVREWREAVRSKVGLRPNRAVISADAFNAAAEHPKVLERFKYTSSDSITAEMLARLFNLQELAIGEAVYMNEGGSEMEDVWGRDFVLAFTPQQVMSRRQPSFGYTYTLAGHPAVEQAYSERNAKSWLYPVVYDRQPVIAGADSGFLAQNVVPSS